MNDISDHHVFKNDSGDMKLRYFLERCLPQDIGTDDIKLMTHQKIARQRKRRKRLLAIWGVAACLALSIILYMPLHPSAPLASGNDRPAIPRERQERLRILTVPIGTTRTLQLADGTRVVANSRTTIRYPEHFKGETREISINGEAYLEVAHDRRHPFVVHGDQFDVRVLGTKFNYSSYHGKSSSVALVEGSVEVKTSHDAVRMRPNHLIRLEKGAVSEFTQVNAADFASWTKGFVYLNGQSARQICMQLEDYYGIRISCAPGIAAKRLYGKLALGPDYSQALRFIAFLTDAHCERHQGHIHFNENE